MLKAIIFDMDGVLVNSTGYNRKSFAEAFKKYGVTENQIKASDKKRYLGRSLSDQLKMRKEEFNIKKNISEEDFSQEAYKCQKELMRDVLIPDEKTQELVTLAKKKGIKMAVATSSLKYRAIDMLKLVNIYNKLDVLVTCEDVKNGKPNPEIFLKAAELININPENCLVIEDAVNGIQAAKQANMKAIAKLGTHHNEDDFESADMSFKDFSEISLEDLENLWKI